MSPGVSPNTEISVRLRLHRTLYEDAQKCAKAANMNPERFMSEVIEQYVAGRRWEKTLPGQSVNTDGNLKF